MQYTLYTPYLSLNDCSFFHCTLFSLFFLSVPIELYDFTSLTIHVPSTCAHIYIYFIFISSSSTCLLRLLLGGGTEGLNLWERRTKNVNWLQCSIILANNTTSTKNTLEQRQPKTAVLGLRPSHDQDGTARGGGNCSL